MKENKKKIIDASYHQGLINWETAKAHIDGAILRCGYGSDMEKQDDKQFHRNAQECTRLGIPFGVYLYSYAKTVEQAKSEAEHVLRVIKGYKLSFPIYYDLEDAGTTGQCNNATILEIARVFGDTIEAAGYWCGIYANKYWWEHKLNNKFYDRFTKWVAQYNTKCTYQGKYDMWQYSSKGSVPGINGNVDMNECYRDFPKLINKTGNTGSNDNKSAKIYRVEVGMFTKNEAEIFIADLKSKGFTAELKS